MRALARLPRLDAPPSPPCRPALLVPAVLCVALACTATAQLVIWSSATSPSIRNAHDTWVDVLVPDAKLVDRAVFALQVIKLSKQFLNNYFRLEQEFVEVFKLPQQRAELQLQFKSGYEGLQRFELVPGNYSIIDQLFNYSDRKIESARFIHHVCKWSLHAKVQSFTIFHTPILLNWDIWLRASFESNHEGDLELVAQLQ
jgi:hypothetical protein